MPPAERAEGTEAYIPRAEAKAIRYRLVFVALILLSLGLRVWGLHAQSIWRDEADSLRFAGDPVLLAEMFTTPGHNAPAYYLMLRVWSGMVGDGIVAARLFSALWGVLAVALLYVVGRRLFDRRVATVAALFAGCSPYLIWYSQEARTYMPLLAVVLLALWLLLVGLQDGRRWALAGFLLAASLSLYLHVVAALMLPVYALAAVLLARAGRWRWLLWAAPALLALPLLPLLGWQLPLLFSPFRTGHAVVAPAEAAAGLLLALNGGAGGQLGLWWTLPGIFLALVGAASPWLAGGNGRRRAHPLVVAWLLLPVAGLLLVSLGMPVFSERYIIFVAPAYYLLVALGLVTLAGHWRPAAGAALALLLAISGAGIWAQTTQTIKPDFRAAAAYYEQHAEPGDAVLFLIPQGEGAFGEYAPAGATAYLPAPFANGLSPAALSDQLTQQLVGHRRVWLLESERELWDRQGQIRAWLEARGRLAAAGDFHLVTLRLFVIAGP
jgi:mannosyltransferase